MQLRFVQSSGVGLILAEFKLIADFVKNNINNRRSPAAVWDSWTTHSDAVCVAVDLRLDCSVRVAHTCRCGSPVLSNTHGVAFMAPMCNKAPSKTTRHHAINDAVARSLIAARVPVTKEPCGLTTTDDKRRDGLTLPWQAADLRCYGSQHPSPVIPVCWWCGVQLKPRGTEKNRLGRP